MENISSNVFILWILVVCVGNFIVSALILAVRLFIGFMFLIGSVVSLFFGGAEGALTSFVNAIYHALLTAIVAGLTWLWTQIGVFLVMKSSRDNEYLADQFSFYLGYGNELCMILDTICGIQPKGLFASLASSHPDKNERIARLQWMGATYRANYGTPNGPNYGQPGPY